MQKNPQHENSQGPSPQNRWLRRGLLPTCVCIYQHVVCTGGPDLGRSALRFVTLTTAGQVDAFGSSCAPSGRVSVLPWAGGVRRDAPRDPGMGSRLGVRRLSPTCAPRRLA